MEHIEIPLTQGKVAVIDSADLPLVGGKKWYALKPNGTTWYAANRGPRPERKMMYMHAVILPVEPPLTVDHKDGDGLNNRRNNLRQATPSQQLMNKRTWKGRKYKGVYWHKSRCVWKVEIGVGGKRIRRTAGSQAEAAAIYNQLAAKHHGEFAKLNVLEEESPCKK